MTQSIASTRDRLLEAASREFADKGFDRATVAEICRKADANIAAINYHFGGKEALYQEAWKHAFRRSSRAVPPDGGIASGAPAEERLRGRIRALLRRAMGDDGLEFRIMGHEMASPTGLLGQIVRDTLAPLRQSMEGIVVELLGTRPDELTIRLCVTSVLGPCLQLARRQRIDARDAIGPRLGPHMIDSMADHFTAFALAGIREVRRRLEDGKHRGNGRAETRGTP